MYFKESLFEEIKGPSQSPLLNAALLTDTIPGYLMLNPGAYLKYGVETISIVP